MGWYGLQKMAKNEWYPMPLNTDYKFSKRY